MSCELIVYHFIKLFPKLPFNSDQTELFVVLKLCHKVFIFKWTHQGTFWPMYRTRKLDSISHEKMLRDMTKPTFYILTFVEHIQILSVTFPVHWYKKSHSVWLLNNWNIQLNIKYCWGNKILLTCLLVCPQAPWIIRSQVVEHSDLCRTKDRISLVPSFLKFFRAAFRISWFPISLNQNIKCTNRDKLNSVFTNHVNS